MRNRKWPKWCAMVTIPALLGFALALPRQAGAGLGAETGIDAVRLQEPGYARHRIIVKFKEEVSPRAQKEFAQTQAADIECDFPSISSRLHVYQLPETVEVEAAAAVFGNDPEVEYVEPDYRLDAFELLPNDQFFDTLWGLRNTGQYPEYVSRVPFSIDIDATSAWGITTGSGEVVVGIIDTGIDYNHPDLSANIWTNPGEVPGNGVDDDGNGYVDDVHGWCTARKSGDPEYDVECGIRDTTDPMDDSGHGTHLAGTIGAVGNNLHGVTGINWNVKLMAIKSLNACGLGSLSGALEAIDYAIGMRRRGVNLRILNASWGQKTRSRSLKAAIQAANQAGILFVAAAGNCARNIDAFPVCPASFQLPGLIAVAAIDPGGELAEFSNFGARCVALGAPGVGILSTVPGGDYVTWSGTSMAAPHVAGTAALLLSEIPEATVERLKDALLRGAVPLPSLLGKTTTGGVVNAYNSLLIIQGSQSAGPEGSAGRRQVAKDPAAKFNMGL